MANVEFSHVTKLYGTHEAVSDLSFTCADGEFLVLLGAAGAGKTTTLKMISGIESPSQGVIRLGGRVANNLPPQARNVAMVFENYALYPHLTVFENMAFPLRAPIRTSRLSNDEINKRVREIATMLEIHMLLDRLPTQLSGGQRQRTSLGRALVRNPDVMLLDEPIAHLDAQLRSTMRGELKRLQKATAVTTVYATPDYAQALGMADRIAVLHKGKIGQTGTPIDVYENPATTAIAEALGDPKINLIEAELSYLDGNVIIATNFGHFKIDPISNSRFHDVAPGKYILGVRPVDVHVTLEPIPDTAIAARLTLAEPLGSSVIVTLSMGTSELKAKVPNDRRWRANSQVWVEIASDRMLIFDRITGANVGRARS